MGMSEGKQQKEQVEGSNAPGVVFISCAIGVNIFGLTALTFNSVSIAGNIPAAEAVLTSALACLSASIVSIARKYRQKVKGKNKEKQDFSC